MQLFLFGSWKLWTSLRIPYCLFLLVKDISPGTESRWLDTGFTFSFHLKFVTFRWSRYAICWKVFPTLFCYKRCVFLGHPHHPYDFWVSHISLMIFGSLTLFLWFLGQPYHPNYFWASHIILMISGPATLFLWFLGQLHYPYDSSNLMLLLCLQYA